MSHVTQGQAKRLKELGYPQGDLNETERAVQCDCGLQMMHADLDTDWIVGMDYSHCAHDWDIDHAWWRSPSAEELMEWLKENTTRTKTVSTENEWCIEVTLWYSDAGERDFKADTLIDALFQAACWALGRIAMTETNTTRSSKKY